jgi:D-glycerate 3-kinase
LTTCLEKAMFEALGIRTAVVSYDDFYLTHDDQSEVAKANPSNPFMQGRGVAGSHDMQLGSQVLEELIFKSKENQSVKVPQYDKSRFGGQGDRVAKNHWKQIEGKIDLVMVEGWMLGYE